MIESPLCIVAEENMKFKLPLVVVSIKINQDSRQDPQKVIKTDKNIRL